MLQDYPSSVQPVQVYLLFVLFFVVGLLESVQGDHSVWKQPPIDLVPALVGRNCICVQNLSQREVVTTDNGHPVVEREMGQSSVPTLPVSQHSAELLAGVGPVGVSARLATRNVATESASHTTPHTVTCRGGGDGICCRIK